MKSRGVYISAAVVGPIVGLAGMIGIWFGFGLPAPYWLAAVLFGAALILFGQRGIKQTRPVVVSDPADPNAMSDREMEMLARKRHQFWIFVAIASSLYAVGAYWLPFTTPLMRRHLVEVFMVGTFGLCIGIFIYSSYTNRRM